MVTLSSRYREPLSKSCVVGGTGSGITSEANADLACLLNKVGANWLWLGAGAALHVRSTFDPSIPVLCEIACNCLYDLYVYICMSVAAAPGFKPRAAVGGSGERPEAPPHSQHAGAT